MVAEYLTVQRFDPNHALLYLVAGLRDYQHFKQTTIPGSLRKALNQLALSWNAPPKTLYHFLNLCHSPVGHWYPLPLPENFDGSHPLLYDDQLSEEAESFWMEWEDQMDFPLSDTADLPQAALDSQIMKKFRQRLRTMPDVQAAQARYVEVRSFLIEHSCATSDQLREGHALEVYQDLRLFFEEHPKLRMNSLLVCDRCGLLEYRNEGWYGVKPAFCSDHASDSPHVHIIPNRRDLYRLKSHVHQRVFLPGRLELALFQFAEAAQAQYPDQLIQVERYPGFDTYDLRLTFQGKKAQEVWAIDAKDHASPKWLAPQIRPMYAEGALAHDRAFYVLPDSRLDDETYRTRLEYKVGVLPPNLHLISLSTFKQQVTDKLMRLSRPIRRTKRR